MTYFIGRSDQPGHEPIKSFGPFKLNDPSKTMSLEIIHGIKTFPGVTGTLGDDNFYTVSVDITDLSRAGLYPLIIRVSVDNIKDETFVFNLTLVNFESNLPTIDNPIIYRLTNQIKEVNIEPFDFVVIPDSFNGLDS